MALVHGGALVHLVARTVARMPRKCEEIRCLAKKATEWTWRLAARPRPRAIRGGVPRRCCTDPTGGARSWAGVAGRPLTCPPDARRAFQAEPGPPPPYSPAEAPGNKLARVRRRPPPARELDGLVHR